ncbi:hypothetical protein [Candidatus Sororendozoicomonas aggregata]|uniref:hypothetical protein n=1 Tax=Candidatus Sororendozoicomonas aggregata TaxID=3073239 RepID=UPI002ED48901
MRKNPLLQLRTCMANKSFVFFTGVLSLCVLGNAYGRNTEISIKNLISPDSPYYSKKGYEIEPMGKGQCMIGVYNRHSLNARYGKPYGQIGIHYKSAWGCAFRDSIQKFKVTNNDTGKLLGTFEWKKEAGDNPYIHNIKGDRWLMFNVTHLPFDMKHRLNFRTGHHEG